MKEPYFEVWHQESGNRVGTFSTPEGAFSFLNETYETSFEFLLGWNDGEPHLIAEGIALYLAVSTWRKNSGNGS